MKPAETQQEITIRRATAQDAELIARIGKRMFRESFDSLNRPDDMAAYLAVNFSTAKIDEDIADPRTTYLIAFKRDLPVGYAKLSATPPPDCVRGPRPIELVRIYLDQNAIGRGWGSILMRACIGEARGGGHETLWLGTWEKTRMPSHFTRSGVLKSWVKKSSSWGPMSRMTLSWRNP